MPKTKSKHGYKHKHGRKKHRRAKTENKTPEAAQRLSPAVAAQGVAARKLSPYALRLLGRQNSPTITKYRDAAEAFQRADRNHDGMITQDEFKEWFAGLSPDQKGAVPQAARSMIKKSSSSKQISQRIESLQKGKPSPRPSQNGGAPGKVRAQRRLARSLDSAAQTQGGGMKRRTNKIRTVVIAGPPAGGKGTLCDCIKSELDLVHISTGALLRDAAKTDRHLAARMATGALVDTEMVFGFLEKRMGMKDAMTRGVLLDGFPRNKRQAAMLRASGRSVDIFMLLNVNDSICEGRVLGRAATAKKQGRPAREDDTSEVIRNRLKIYHATIAEFASCYDRCTIVIDGNGSRGHVQELARNALADPAAAMKSLKRKLKEDAVDAVHKHVRSKPSRDSLVKKGILQEHAFVVKLDPSLAAPAKKLQKSFKCDVLSQNLRNRPTKKELHKRNILHEDHHADKIGRTLVQASKKLEKSLKKVLLKQKLENRPTVKQLKAKNIIHESHGEVANAIAGTTKILETAIKKDALSQTLRKRQSLNAIHDAGIADKFHPHFKGHPDVTSAPLTNGIDKSKDGDQNLKQCLAEVRRALKNLRELRGWLDKIPV